MISKPIIGILGAIGSGKSTVARLFGESGFAVIDADKLVDELYHDKEFIRNKLLPIFGEKVIDCCGKVNRKAISDVVFNDSQKLKELNSVVHPSIIAEFERKTIVLKSAEGVRGVVWDVPLLVETGMHNSCDYLIFVEANIENCVDRVVKRSGIQKKEWKKRQNSQILLDKKKKLANYIIYNNADTYALTGQVADVISGIFHNCSGD